MTCKDCVHYEVCRHFVDLINPLLADHNRIDINENTDICKEHFQDRSRFVELPCKVGDTIYEIVERRKSGEWINKIIPRTVEQIEVWKNGIGFRCGTTIWISDNSAFFTREEAEQALKERENNG